MAEEEKVEPAAKPMGLQLNKEQSALLLKALKGLPDADRKSVVYDALHKDLQTINLLWDRIIKNQKIMADQRRSRALAKKQAQQSAPKQP